MDRGPSGLEAQWAEWNGILPKETLQPSDLLRLEKAIIIRRVPRKPWPQDFSSREGRYVVLGKPAGSGISAEKWAGVEVVPGSTGLSSGRNGTGA